MEGSRDRRAEFCPLWRSFHFRAPGVYAAGRPVSSRATMSVRTIAAGGRGRTVAPDSASTGAARSARAFELARRHSRLVRILRVAFIVGGVGGVVALTGLGLYRTFGGAIGGLSIGDLSVDGTKITMDRPRLTGARPDGGSYVINAAKAIQDVKDPTEVDLVEIDGDIVPHGRDRMRLSATSGHYDSGHERLDLSGVVRLKNSSYTIDLRSAHIDFKTGVYSSREPVTVVTASGTSISADSGWARDNGKEFRFEGHVKSTIRPNSSDSAAGESIKGTQR